MDPYLKSYRTSPFSISTGPDSFSYYYRRSPHSNISKSMELSYSKSTGSLYTSSWHSPVAREKEPDMREIHSCSGFSPLRSPSRPVTIDAVRSHLKDIYRDQLSIQSAVWSNLLKNQSKLPVVEMSPNLLHSSSKLLIIENGENGRIIKDFDKELLQINSTTQRRIRITGEMGSGKSTLLQNLILTWCSDDSDLSYDFPILLYIRPEDAYGRRTLEDILQGLLPPAELKLVLRMLNDWNTRTQVLFVLDDCEKYTQGQWTNGQLVKYSSDYENDQSRTFPYPLDMSRLIKGRYLPETMVIFTMTKLHEQESMKNGKTLNYTIYGLDQGWTGDPIKARNPLRETLKAILNGKRFVEFDHDEILYPGAEKAVTEILSRMSRPAHMTLEECIKILGILSLMTCQDYLPALSFDSNHVLERKKETFQYDERAREDAEDVLQAAIDCGLLSPYGTGLVITTTVIPDTLTPPRKRYDYVLSFPHQTFALYLAARTFVSLNLFIDWSRIGQSQLTGNGADSVSVSNQRYFLYFLTGVDPGYGQDMIQRGLRRENGSDRSFSLPWMVSDAGNRSKNTISAHADDHFTVIGTGEISDSIILNKLTVYYRSGTERALDFDWVLFTDAFDYEGPPITFLRFRHCTMHDQFFRLSSRGLLDNLTNLEFYDCHFRSDNAVDSFIFRLSNLSPTLTSLKINKCQKLAESIDLMRSIGFKMYRLHTLQISGVKDTEKSQKSMMALAECLDKPSTIRRLLLNKNHIADILFPVIINHTELEELDLSDCRFTNEIRAWTRFVDGLKSKPFSPLKRSLITIRLDGNEAVGDTWALGQTLESCERLKLISVRNCFRSPVEAERFKDEMRRRQNVNGFNRDVFI